MKRTLMMILIITALLITTVPVSAAPASKTIGINVVLNTAPTEAILADLGMRGTVLKVMVELNALTMRTSSALLPSIRKLPYVAAANPDAERYGAPIDTVAATDFIDGLSTWNLDAIDVTNYDVTSKTSSRTVPYDGTGVYVAVLDTGLLDSWRQYFPEERIAEEYAASFGGGGGEAAPVSEQPNKWEHDQNSHGTHVTSTILGYSIGGSASVNGVAPMVTIIPVKVLNQNGSGWSSVIAEGITYVAELKAGPLADSPVIINMSLGGSALDAIEKKAIDDAIEKGVIIVASAGNEGEAGMGYPGAYAPVISVAAFGWVGEWTAPNWWRYLDVRDPIEPSDFYITDFSSRALDGQDLDVAAPGSWILGPYQVNSGQLSYYYLGGTSMASPHVAGIVALMAQKDPGMTAPQAEIALEESVIPLPPGSRTIYGSNGLPLTISWGSDATGWGLVNAQAALGLNNNASNAPGKPGKKK